jgi:hypothetical protein
MTDRPETPGEETVPLWPDEPTKTARASTPDVPDQAGSPDPSATAPAAPPPAVPAAPPPAAPPPADAAALAEARQEAEFRAVVADADAGAPPPRPSPPAWVWPSIVAGLAYPALANSARLDAEMIERLPEPKAERFRGLSRLPKFWTLVVVGAAVLIALVFGLFRLGITDVYSESMVFMLLALVLGMISPAAGLLMVLLFIPFDVYKSSDAGTMEPFFPALAGRAVSWWLLWLLVVALPLMARALPGASLATGTPKNPTLRKVIAYGAGGAAAGVLLLMWVGAAPFLLRPVFIWSDRFGSPTVPAIQPIQESGLIIVAVGVIAVLAVTLLRDRLNVLDDEATGLNAPQDIGVADEPLMSDELQFFARLITDAFAVAALGGLITGALDVAILFGTLIIAKPVADRLLKRVPILLDALSRVPWVLRFLGGFAFTYIAGLVINGALTNTTVGDSEFFSIVVSVAVGLFFLQILLEADAIADEVADERADRDALPPAPDSPIAPASAGGAGLAILAAALLLSAFSIFTVPAAVRADNCSSKSDCPQTADAEAGAAAGAAAVVAVTVILAGMRVSDNRSRHRKIRRRKRIPPDAGAMVPPTSPVAPPPSITQRVRQRMLGNYYRD